MQLNLIIKLKQTYATSLTSPALALPDPIVLASQTSGYFTQSPNPDDMSKKIVLTKIGPIELELRVPDDQFYFSI